MENIIFESQQLKIHGILTRGDRERGVIVTHPHPFYGGDMFNPVVETLVNAYQSKGFTTLRFNFRGTGRSEGGFENGQGERIDVISAEAYLCGLGVERIDLAGYSFGTWVNSLAVDDCVAVKRMVMVAPPVCFIDFSVARSLPLLEWVIAGEHDAFAPLKNLRTWMAATAKAAKLEIVAGADHFFSGCLDDVRRILDRCLTVL